MAQSPNNGNNNAVGAMPVQVFPCFGAPLGYQQLTALTSAEGLTVPAGTVFAMISAEAQAVRYRDDGTNPTATVGMPIPAGSTISYAASLSTVKFIGEAAGAILNVSYYG